jgi:hypothetical protein
MTLTCPICCPTTNWEQKWIRSERGEQVFQVLCQQRGLRAICIILYVNMWPGYGSRCQAHRIECVKLFMLNSFPNVSKMVQCDTTVESIGVNMGQHLRGKCVTPCRVHSPTNWGCSDGKRGTISARYVRLHYEWNSCHTVSYELDDVPQIKKKGYWSHTQIKIKSNVFIKTFLHQQMLKSAYTEPQPKTPNSKQCRCSSTIERQEPRKKPREEPGSI